MLWLRQGNDVIRLKDAQATQAPPAHGGQRLAGVPIFRRDAEGILVQRLDAASAPVAGAGRVPSHCARLDVASHTVASQPPPR